MKCPICEASDLVGEDAIKMQACDWCAKTVGLVPMPPASRPPKPCSTCGGRKFLRAIPREHTSSGESSQVSVPMMLTHKPYGDKSVFGNSPRPLDITRGWGWLEVYACYGCGKVEWFCPDVADVPIHPHLMTDVVEYDAGGPYR